MSLNKITRVILHWTAGSYMPNSIDRSHYHYMTALDNNGVYIEKGKFSVEDNINCKDGKYAEHTGGGNTGSLGWAICGMLGYKNPQDVGDFPITKEQFELTCSEIAKFCKANNIPVTPLTVLTHYEFGLAHPTSSSAGKIDISFLPYKVSINSEIRYLKPEEIGDFIRNKVKWYLK